jgi:hypothetical protein
MAKPVVYRFRDDIAEWQRWIFLRYHGSYGWPTW